jgi:serine/threonine protein kinase
MIWYGYTGTSNVLVMSLLGKSLAHYLRKQTRFGIQTTAFLIRQIVSVLKILHNNCYIHRDLKPHNILMGPKRQPNKVYLIDFGLSKLFMDEKSHMHTKYRNTAAI